MTVRDQLEAAREELQETENRLEAAREELEDTEDELEEAKSNVLLFREVLEDVSDEVKVTLEILQRLQWNTKNVSPEALLGVLAEFFQNDLETCILNLQQVQQEVQAG